jgi:DNA invertase Pin-like site-specific DNA recombinase
MRTAIYARVSTQDKGQNVDVQLDELRDYCQRREWEVVSEFVDDGISGTKTDRPALNRLMSDARQRKFDCLIVWKFDRFGRSLAHLILSLQEFDSLGISFVSLRDGIDLTTPIGRLQFGIISSVAEFERSLIVERTRAGLAHAKRIGKHCGRPACGISGDDIRSMLAQGMRKPEIAAKLNVSLGTVYNQLR